VKDDTGLFRLTVIGVLVVIGLPSGGRLLQ
jgi:hypothetical protein